MITFYSKQVPELHVLSVDTVEISYSCKKPSDIIIIHVTGNVNNEQEVSI